MRQSWAGIPSSLLIVAWVVIAAIGVAARASAQSKLARKLSCTPSLLTSNSTLTIRFPSPHPAELGIEAPDGTYFALVYKRDPTTPPAQRPLVETESFLKMTKLGLRVSTAIASPLYMVELPMNGFFESRVSIKSS